MADVDNKWVAFAERVGGPTVILLAVMWGIYTLFDGFLSQQISLLQRISADSERTRIVVELDADEHKDELLRELLTAVEQGFAEIKIILRPTRGKTPHE